MPDPVAHPDPHEAAKNRATAAHADVSHEPAGRGEDAAGHGHGDAHAETLGPIDWVAWGAGAIGVVLGLVVIAALILAGQPA